MTFSANITKIEVPHDFKNTSDIGVSFEVMDLGISEFIHKSTNKVTLDKLIDKMKEDNLKAGNFYIKNNLPVVLDKFFNVTKLTEEETNSIYTLSGDSSETLSVKEPTVVSILIKLAKFKSKLKFQESYYTTKTGGASFENFIPDFDSAEMNASNLIISAKKFNIVLTATIKGEVSIEHGYTEIYRYHPFKLVKFGELIHDKIYVVVDEYNEEFLRTLNYSKMHERTETDTVIEIDLSKYNIFETERLNMSMNNFLILIRSIRAIKLKNKAYNYTLRELRKYMDSDSLLATKREWFNGEEVDDDYVSDEGTEYLDVWEKGKKTMISVDRLLNELSDYGKSTRDLITSISQLEVVDEQQLKPVITASIESVSELLKSGTIKQDEAALLGILSYSLGFKGTKEERAKELIKNIKQEAIVLNILELKFLTLRWNLYNSLTEKEMYKNNIVFKLGNITKQTSDSVDLESPQGSIVIKKGRVENTGYRYTKEDNESNGFADEDSWRKLLSNSSISESIEEED